MKTAPTDAGCVLWRSAERRMMAGSFRLGRSFHGNE
jgi:hypothetical protein